MGDHYKREGLSPKGFSTERRQVRRVYPRVPRQPFLLLAEDCETFRSLLVATLVEQGHNVLPAENGRIALDLFLEHRASIKLLVTDLSMPEMSGAELIAEVRRVAPTMPVLVTSTAGDSHRQLLGDDIHFLAKPFPLETFTRTVRKMRDARYEMRDESVLTNRLSRCLVSRIPLPVSRISRRA